MTFEHYVGFLFFAFVASATPGPNNLMLVASGANHGVRRTVPHMLGIAFGFALLVFLTGLGLARLLAALPLLEKVLGLLAFGFILHLAWRIATAPPPAPDAALEGRGGPKGVLRQRPLRFLEALAFQWVNPKGWAMALAALTTYVPNHDMIGTVVVTLTYAALVMPLALAWTALGVQIGRWLSGPRRIPFNRIMAVLLVVSLVPVLLG